VYQVGINKGKKFVVGLLLFVYLFT